MSLTISLFSLSEPEIVRNCIVVTMAGFVNRLRSLSPGFCSRSTPAPALTNSEAAPAPDDPYLDDNAKQTRPEDAEGAPSLDPGTTQPLLPSPGPPPPYISRTTQEERPGIFQFGTSGTTAGSFPSFGTHPQEQPQRFHIATPSPPQSRPRQRRSASPKPISANDLNTMRDAVKRGLNRSAGGGGTLVDPSRRASRSPRPTIFAPPRGRMGQYPSRQRHKLCGRNGKMSFPHLRWIPSEQSCPAGPSDRAATS